MPPAVTLGLINWPKDSELKPWSWTQVFFLQTICKTRYVLMKTALLHNVSRLALPTAPISEYLSLAEISRPLFEKEIAEEEEKKRRHHFCTENNYFFQHLGFTVILHKTKFTRPLNVVYWLSLYQYFQFPHLCLPLQTNPLTSNTKSHFRLVVTGQ